MMLVGTGWTCIRREDVSIVLQRLTHVIVKNMLKMMIKEESLP